MLPAAGPMEEVHEPDTAAGMVEVAAKLSGRRQVQFEDPGIDTAAHSAKGTAAAHAEYLLR